MHVCMFSSNRAYVLHCRLLFCVLFNALYLMPMLVVYKYCVNLSSRAHVLYTSCALGLLFGILFNAHAYSMYMLVVNLYVFIQ